MLSKTIKINQKTIYLTTTALFAALVCLTTAYIFHIPFGFNGGYVHIGDALIYLAAALLPTPYAMAAAALGGLFADLLTAPIWAPATFFIKMLIALPFTSKKEKIVNIQNAIAVFVAAIISIAGYYVAESIIFGREAALIASVTSSLIQAVCSAALFLSFGHVLDKMHFKSKIRFM